MADIAAALIEPGDLITLSGDLGAGKTTFARALIRHSPATTAIEVPSPTFTLMQSYDLPRFPVVHADLYRLGGAGRTRRARLRRPAPEDAVMLLEWPDRAGGLPAARPARYRVHAVAAAGPRHSAMRAITGYGALRRARRAHRRRSAAFSTTAGFGRATRTRIQGDASTRSYERLTRDGDQRSILMNSPRRPDGPPVRDGKPYSAIAHLAEDVTPFIAMANGPAPARLLGAGRSTTPTATPAC